MKKVKRFNMLLLMCFIVSTVLVVGCSKKQVNTPSSNDTSQGSGDNSDEQNQESISTEESETSEMSTPEGIVSLSVFVDNSVSGTNSGLRLNIINPQTGHASFFKEFTYPSEMVKNLAFYPANTVLQYSAGVPILARQAFDERYTKLAISLIKSEVGSEHVGYIEDTGNCVDISKLILGKSSSFSDKQTKHSNPRFGRDGYFYFTDSDIEKRVHLSNATPESVEDAREDTSEQFTDSESKKDYSSDLKKFFAVKEGNEVLVKYNPETDIPRYERGFMDWIDEETFLMDDFTVHKVFSEPAPTLTEIKQSPEQWAGRIEGGQFTTEARQLLPENERKNVNPIPSPDGKTIAFMSQISNSKSKNWSLFIVDADGGEPTEVGSLDTMETNQAFIDWM